MRKCPVCPRTDISQDALVCPGCGADLKPLKHIEELPSLYYNQALDSVSRDDIEGALELVSASLAMDQNFVQARVLYAKLLCRGKRIQEAKHQLETVLKNDTNNQEAQNNLLKINTQLRWKTIRTSILSVATLLIVVFFSVYSFQSNNRLSRSSEKMYAQKSQLTSMSNTVTRLKKQVEQASRKRASFREYIAKLKDMIKHLEEE